MIPLTFLYDEYIDRPKFTEQKKNPFEYIVPSPTSGVGTIKTNPHIYAHHHKHSHTYEKTKPVSKYKLRFVEFVPS